MSDTPLYDQLVNERLGRGPAEFEGHDTWDQSAEARAAYARGVAEGKARTQVLAMAQKHEQVGRPAQARSEDLVPAAGRRSRG